MVIRRRVLKSPPRPKLNADGPAGYRALMALSNVMHKMLYRHLMFAIRRIAKGEDVAIHVLLDLYMFAAYCYYQLNTPIMSDGEFDALAKNIQKRWKVAKLAAAKRDIPVTKADVDAGTFLGEYPRAVQIWGAIHLTELERESQ